jgi:hypothetical protein
MSNFKLNLPTDIPWERICVTEDMVDTEICDARRPPKWQTSMAVFKYVPDDEDQLFPPYKISYLKVTATITGYQPLSQEIQGTIDWHGVDVSTIPGLTDLLNSYNPCHGAILQVSVGPHGDRRAVPPDEYPFFMDFEPKKRELYEMATDTQEKQSRTIESLNVTKSAGNTQSLEILDVDQGGGGFGMQSTYAGTGGGFNYTAPNGQWGTKRLNADESLSSRSSDVGTEKRETFSHSTQISQMYHLLDSYHLGTNRAVFFVQPRPHVLEEPSGFVRGPRPVEGIQEFFLVVAQPKDEDDFCVALRLDTSHLTTTPIMDYDRKSESTSIAVANAAVASDHDIPAENIVGARACFFDCWDVHYQCYRTESVDAVTYDAPAGYRIEGFNDLINEATHGSTAVVVTPNQQTLNINVSANGHICYEGSEVCVDCPDTIQAWAGHARRQVQVNLVSTTPTKKVGEDQALMITTRGLCCCASERGKLEHLKEMVVDIQPIPADLKPARPDRRSLMTTTAMMADEPQFALAASSGHAHGDEPCTECAEKLAAAGVPAGGRSAGYTIRQANALSDHIRTQTLRSLNDPYAEPRSFIDTDFFAKTLEQYVVQTRQGRSLMEKPAAEVLPQRALSRLGKHLGVEVESLTVRDAWRLRTAELSEVAGVGMDELRRARLESLGIAFVPEKTAKTAKTGSKPGRTSAS